MRSAFLKDGFVLVPKLLAAEEISSLVEALNQVESSAAVRKRGGVFAIRNLLQLAPEIGQLANSLRLLQVIEAATGTPAFPVRGILFDKTVEANWLVPWHQDLTICVKQRLDAPGYGPWSIKSGVHHVQPPTSILESMASIRLNLDDCNHTDGALRVLPGTHLGGRLTDSAIAEHHANGKEVYCTGNAGDALLIRPLLLHASSAAAEPRHRRVIHIDYAATPLDGGLQWFED